MVHAGLSISREELDHLVLTFPSDARDCWEQTNGTEDECEDDCYPVPPVLEPAMAPGSLLRGVTGC